MVTIQIISTGTLKENYLLQACEEYKKRLGAFCKVEETVLKEERLPENPSAKEIENTLIAEEKNVLSKINPKSYVVALCIEGKQFSSEELSSHLQNVIGNGFSEITFVVGSSFGLSQAVKNRANLCLSFSKMTFPHQLFRVLLYEAIYRSFAIMNGSKYHK